MPDRWNDISLPIHVWDEHAKILIFVDETIYRENIISSFDYLIKYLYELNWRCVRINPSSRIAIIAPGTSPTATRTILVNSFCLDVKWL